MPENNEPQYELDHDYAPLGIVDAADGSGTTWPEFVGQVNKMDNQVAALTEDMNSRFQIKKVGLWSDYFNCSGNASCQIIVDLPVPDGWMPLSVARVSVSSPANYVLAGFELINNEIIANVRKITNGDGTVRLTVAAILVKSDDERATSGQ